MQKSHVGTGPLERYLVQGRRLNALSSKKHHFRADLISVSREAAAIEMY